MKLLNKEFKNWLTTLNFAESSIKSFPVYTNEMLHWIEEQEPTEVNELQAITINNFFFYWKNRKNKRTGAGLSQNHVNKGITAINLFVKFLNQTKNNPIQIKLERDKQQLKIPTVLTIKEIEQIYEATYSLNKRGNAKAYGQRDRAMLSVYYGCGLRRNEGINLKITDILLDKKLVLVRKGKGNKERFIPLAERGIKDIEEYLNFGRKWFLKPRQKQNNQSETEFFFINLKGNPMQSFTQRIKLLTEEARIEKETSLHTFRHSIATHLLQKGMDIEQIKKFLGHSSLESTQLYTHIINEHI